MNDQFSVLLWQNVYCSVCVSIESSTLLSAKAPLYLLFVFHALEEDTRILNPEPSLLKIKPFGGVTQVEKSEARQYLQLAQYCASCNWGVIPVLAVNTLPNIGVLLAYYWRGILWQYWWNSEVGVSLTVGTLLVYCGRSTDYYYQYQLIILDQYSF